MGHQIPELVPGSPEWLAHMSASKIAAVVRLSPYQSRRSLWDVMAGRIPAPDVNDAMRRGHYLEDGIAAWYADQHPEAELRPGGTWAHDDHPWATANPDRLIHQDGQLVGLLQIKTAGDSAEWGPSGTEDIPIGYRAQVMWEMEVCGAPWCDVAVLLPGLSFREYRVHYSAEEAAALLAAGEAFMESLDWGEPPELDGDDATYQAVRREHPDIDREAVYDLDLHEAASFIAAHEALEDAKRGWNLARAEMAEAMGAAWKARWVGEDVAIRKAKNGGTPWVEAAKNLPDMSGLKTVKEAA